jgi:hypothetical protein
MSAVPRLIVQAADFVAWFSLMSIDGLSHK